MATVNWYGDSGYNLALVDFGYLSVATGYARSSSTYTVKYPAGTKDVFSGSKLRYDGKYLESGTVKTFTGYDDGERTVKISGLALSASAVAKVTKTKSITDDQNLLERALSGDDRFFGGSGSDAIEGFGGDDEIDGGRGADILVGGSGRDTFIYDSVKDSGTSVDTADIILDFTSRDRIDLASIDANKNRSKNQAFDFIGTKKFSGDEGELRYVKFKSETVVEGDVNGDGVADFAILFDDAITFKDDYFIL